MEEGIQQKVDTSDGLIDSFILLSSEAIGQNVLANLNLDFDIIEVSSDALSRTCYDTFDGLFYANGMSLFVERSDSHQMICLKQLDDLSLIGIIPGTDVPHFAADFPEGPLRDLLLRINPTFAFLPQADFSCRQRKMMVLKRAGKEIAHLVIEEQCVVKNIETGRTSTPGPFLHLLPHKKPESDYKRLVQICESLPELKIMKKPFWEAILESIESPIVTGRGRAAFSISSDLTAGETLKQIMRLLLATMEANEPGIRANIDPEFLHDYRIALRRARTIFNQFKDVLPASIRQKLGTELRWLGRVTGALRDLDVYLLRIDDYKSWLPENVRSDLEPLQYFLGQRNEQEHAELVKKFDSQRYQKLVDTWRCFVEDTSDLWVSGKAGQPVRPIVSARIWKLYRKILKQGRAILRGKTVKAAAMHQLRIACKKLRYMLAMFADLYPSSEINKLVSILKRLQDNLGDYQDFEVQGRDLRQFATEMMKDVRIASATFLAMGRLERRMEERQQEAFLAFEERFNEFTRKKNRKRFARLFAPDAG